MPRNWIQLRNIPPINVSSPLTSAPATGRSDHGARRRSNDFDEDERQGFLAGLSPSIPMTPGRTRLIKKTDNCNWFPSIFRRLLALFLLIPAFFLGLLLWIGPPPKYRDIRKFELNLPQHSFALSSIQDVQYLNFEGMTQGTGFGGLLQEVLVMSYLSYITGRAFVFEDYISSDSYVPSLSDSGSIQPSRIPLNAFISGPSAGGPMPSPETLYPRAVSRQFFNAICHKRARVTIETLKAGVPSWLDGKQLMEWWKAKVDYHDDDKCLVIDGKKLQVFNKDLFESSRIHTLFEEMRHSPILQSFEWSPLVRNAITANLDRIKPKDAFTIAQNDTIPGLLVVHLRRTDDIMHCHNLALLHGHYKGLNTLPSIPDRFDPAAHLGSHHKTEAQWDLELLMPYYRKHCAPNVSQVLMRLQQVRHDAKEQSGRDLRKIYIMSNNADWWLGLLSYHLKEAGWEGMTTTMNLVLDEETTYVNAAVDMAIAEKAEVFLGNGFSTLTANVMGRRLTKGLDEKSNRLF